MYRENRHEPYLMRRFSRKLFLTPLEGRVTPAAVSWTGLGGDNQWTTPSNWSGNALPSASDDVTISGADGDVQLQSASATVASLVLNNNLVVQADTLSVTGKFTLNPSKTLTATGAGASFSATGATVIDDGHLAALSSGKISLPGLVSIGFTDYGDVWAQDGGSINLPSLASAGGTGYQRIRAISGGSVSIPSLTKLDSGYWEVNATGAGSVITAPNLATVQFETSYGFVHAQSGGTIAVSPALTSLDWVLATFSGNGFPVEQLTSIQHSNISVTGGSLNFGKLTTFDYSSLIASGGAAVSFPAIFNYDADQSGNLQLQASGSGTTVSVPNLASMTGSNPMFVRLRALSGGTVSLPSLTSINEPSLDVIVSGASSLLDLGKLTSIVGPVELPSTVAVTGSSTFKTASTLTLDRTTLSFDSAAASKFTFASLSIGPEATVRGEGTLQASVTNAGQLSPGRVSVGQLGISGNYVQTPTGTLQIDLGGTVQGTQHDWLSVAGQAQLGGKLSVANVNDFAPALSNSFQILTFATRLGQFGSYQGLISGGVELKPNFSAGDLTLNGVSPHGPAVISISPSGGFSAPVTFIDVTFDEVIDPSSFNIGDFGVVGPSGPYGAISIASLSPTQLRVAVTPLASQGSYAITVGPNVTDAAGILMDQNGNDTPGEGGDAYSDNITITFPDLVVSSITGVPATGNFGQSVTVNWTAQNNGGGTASGTWTDRVWLSSDSVLDGGDVLLGSKSVSANVIPAGSYSTSLGVQLPTNPPRPDGTYYLLVQANALGQLAEGSIANNMTASSSTTLSNPPRVESVAVNHGANQRSRINALTVTFSEIVSGPAPWELAFTLTRATGGGPVAVGLSASPSTVLGKTVVELTFLSGSEFVFDSLVDGNYTLKVNASTVSDGTLNLDGAGNGIPGTDHLFSFFRKYGDSNGDGLVDLTDFSAFRGLFNLPSFTFDFDNDGIVGLSDFSQFRARFNT